MCLSTIKGAVLKLIVYRQPQTELAVELTNAQSNSSLPIVAVQEESCCLSSSCPSTQHLATVGSESPALFLNVLLSLVVSVCDGDNSVCDGDISVCDEDVCL